MTSENEEKTQAKRPSSLADFLRSQTPHVEVRRIDMLGSSEQAQASRDPIVQRDTRPVPSANPQNEEPIEAPPKDLQHFFPDQAVKVTHPDPANSVTRNWVEMRPEVNNPGLQMNPGRITSQGPLKTRTDPHDASSSSASASSLDK